MMANRRSALVSLLAALAASAVPAPAVAVTPVALSDFEGRWVPAVKQRGFAGRIGPFEILRCEPSSPVICLRPVGSDGSCGTEIVPLAPAGGGALEGAYHLSLGVPESETDDDHTQRLRTVRIELEGGRIRMAVTPSLLERMMARAALDDAVVWLDRAGPPECPDASQGTS